MDFLLEACDYELSESEILDNIENELLDEDGRREGESVEEYARRISGFTPQDQVKAEAKRAKQISKAADNAAGKGSTATAAVLGAGSAFAGKENKRNRRIAAGAILGTAALAGTAYAVNKALKKRKAKKAEDRDKESVSECMIDLILDEDYVYITEEDMDFLLEACDYELSESEILDNIENELIQEGFFADLKAKKEAKAAKWAQERKMEQDEAKRLYNQFKSRIPNELKSHNMGMPEWSDENDSDIFNFEFSEEVQENHKEFDKLSEILYQFSKKIEKGTKFEVDTHGDDTVVSIRITGVPKINNESSELIQEGFFDKLKVNKGPSREEKAKAKAQLEEDKKVLTAEAKRLFPLVKTRLTPMLKKAKDDAGDNEFNYYNGLDQSSAKEAEVCICRFDYLPFKDDFGYDNEGYAAFEKMMDKAKTECERLAQFLNNKTEYSVNVELDTNCYYIMIKK